MRTNWETEDRFLHRPSAWGAWWRRLRKSAYLLGHLPQHLALQRLLDTSHIPSKLGALHKARFKYLRVYLARGLSASERYACMEAHYRFWQSLGGTHHARSLLQGDRPLWSRHFEEHVIAIELRPAHQTILEGEFVLNFCLDGTRVAMLTFTIAPGAVFGVQAERVMFIGGLQCRPSSREAIRVASKLNGEIGPLVTLLLAAQGLAAAWGLGGIVGVAAAHQISARGHHAAVMAMAKTEEREKIYDALWTDAGGEALGAWGYALPLDPRDLAHAEPSGSHRARTRRRRMLRAALYEEMLTSADAVLLAETGLIPTVRSEPQRSALRSNGQAFLETISVATRKCAIEPAG